MIYGPNFLAKGNDNLAIYTIFVHFKVAQVTPTKWPQVSPITISFSAESQIGYCLYVCVQSKYDMYSR